MKVEQIKTLLGLVGTSPAGLRGDWVLAKCPFAPWKHDGGVDNHPSFGIKMSKTKPSIYKCFSCGQGGDLGGLVVDLQMLTRRDPRGGVEYQFGAALQLTAQEMVGLDFDSDIPDWGASNRTPTFIEYPSWWLESFPSALNYQEARAYLHSRGLGDNHIEMFDLRYDSLQERVCFPFWNRSGKIAGMQGRAIGLHGSRYHFYDHGGHKNTLVWLGEHTVNLDKPVILVEGPFDYASVYRVYPNVLASFSAGLSAEKIHAIADAYDIITLFDYGKGGDEARKKLRKVLSRPILDLVPVSKDIDAGDMSVSMLASLLEPHVKLAISHPEIFHAHLSLPSRQ